jgi:ubiquinone/menaquinone biosynthesis C-methylase UbiE
MKKEHAEYLIEKTRCDYNLIAKDYARTREFIPDDIKQLAEYTNFGEKVLDSGCANGRLFEVLKEKKVEYYGVDFSERLIEIAKKKYPGGNFFVLNALNLPFKENFFDKVYSISVLHNIPSEEFRRQYLKEIKRVLKPGGLLILRVWDFWRRKEGLKLFFKFAFLKVIKKTKLDFFDVFVPWKNSEGKVLVERYFHCFRMKELENLIKTIDFEIEKIWRGGKDPRTNIYLIAKK